MSERDPHGSFVEKLLRQDGALTDAQLADYRRRLIDRIAKAERREKWMRVAAIAICTVAIVGYLPAMGSYSLQPAEPLDLLRSIGLFVWVACSLVAIPFSLLYFLRYRRALDRARDDAQYTVLMQLERKVAELSERLSPPSS